MAVGFEFSRLEDKAIDFSLRRDVVLTSHRDLRDVAASLIRKFKIEFSRTFSNAKIRCPDSFRSLRQGGGWVW